MPGTELKELLAGGRVTFSLNTFYKMYADNWDLRSGIRKIANKVGIYQNIYHNEKPIEDTEVKKLILSLFTDKERGLNTFAAWKREAVKDFYIAGEMIFIPIILGNGKLQNFQILDPRTVTKIYTKEGVVTEFIQTIGAVRRKYKAENVAYYKFENDHRNPVNGLSLLFSILWDVLSDNKASQRNYYFFENDRVPRAIMKLSWDYDYNDESTKQSVNKIKDGLTGVENSNRTVMSNLIEDVHVIEMSNKDMEFIQQRRLTTDKVASLLWMSKDQLGYTAEINYATAKQFHQNFIQDTILPLQAEWEYILNDLLKRFTVDSEGLYIELVTEDATDEYLEHKDQREDLAVWIYDVNEIREKRGEAPRGEEPEGGEN